MDYRHIANALTVYATVGHQNIRHLEYNLKHHGDHLERSYADFIGCYFKTYEAVWKIFIGNKGNDTKADIQGYSLDKDIKRQNFSEHTYTILQSVILLHRLIEKEHSVNQFQIQPRIFWICKTTFFYFLLI